MLPTPRIIRPLALAMTLGLAAPAARGDDTPPAVAPTAPAAEAPAAGAPAELVEPLMRDDEGLAAIDFRSLHEALMAQVERVIETPQRTDTDHGLYDVWYAVVRPRIARLKTSLAFIGDDARWAVDTSTKRTLGLGADQWSGFVRDAAAANVVLVGMLEGYRDANVKVTLPFGVGVDRPADRVPDDVYLDELGFRGYASELSRRLRARRAAWSDEVRAYRALAGRLNAELIRRGSVVPTQDEPSPEEVLEEASARYDALLADRVDDVGMLLLGLRTYVAVVQSVEEDRLHMLVDESGADADAMKAHHDQLDRLRTTRMDAQRLKLADAGRYGSLLRNDWLAPRRQLRTALGEATETEPEPLTEAPESSAAN